MLCPMFIRRTRTRTGERGEVYYSHRLVRSERTGEKVRQRTLLILDGQQRVTATFRRKDGRTLHVRKATRAEPRQQEIYRALGIDPAPGGIRKTIV